jgi:flavodoxin/formate hydrogenlyase subunit 6/NADH:ubiquinone oxidoreductase subunit I
MNIIRSILGRRQFLIAFISSSIVVIFKRVAGAFGLLFKRSVAETREKPETGEKRPLKGIVVYYSATGSTARVAKAIHLGMKEVIECDIASVKNIDPKEMEKYDVIAIGGPIWYYRETANLRLFIFKMPNMAGKLCVPFCSHGAAPSGFFFSLAQPLRKKGFTIMGWNDWYGSVFHVLHMPKPYLTDGHPDEIDLQDATAFGREMAGRAIKITNGERNLIPDIPTGPDADPLWQDHNRQRRSGGSAGGDAPIERSSPPAAGRGDGGSRGGPGFSQSEQIPIIDFKKCVYPRCRACVDSCVINAIDLSLTAPAKLLSNSPILVKEACIHCSHALCIRSCIYDAIKYEQSQTEHVIHMDKCTYPKCTLCVDNCPMNSIDFSYDPPIIHNNCEGCDLCWCICPEDAIEITNLDQTHARMRMTDTEHGFNQNLVEAEAEGRFRRLVPIDKLGFDNTIFMNPNVPRLVLKEGDWPDMRDKDGNLFENEWPHKGV